MTGLQASENSHLKMNNAGNNNAGNNDTDMDLSDVQTLSNPCVNLSGFINNVNLNDQAGMKIENFQTKT